jgi:hypothetical protein
VQDACEIFGFSYEELGLWCLTWTTISTILQLFRGGQFTMPCKCKFTKYFSPSKQRDRHGRDRMVVGFTTTYAISAYHH